MLKSQRILQQECWISKDYDKLDYNREGTLALYQRALTTCEEELEEALLLLIKIARSKQLSNELTEEVKKIIFKSY